MGARLKLTDRPLVRRWPVGPISLDVGTDAHGEFFAVTVREDADITVIDVQPQDRHLLLLAREQNVKHKYLCGHDERHWFVAAIPEAAPVGTVRQAKEALKPKEVLAAQTRAQLDGLAANRRKNSAFVRQGEWFFLPVDDLVVHETLILKNEPLLRGNGGKPHWAEDCYRTGGELVYVSRRAPNGITKAEYQALMQNDLKAKRLQWRAMRRNPLTYVRGRIRHADHRTIKLHGWHRVLMNTENTAQAMRHVAFLD